MNSLAEIEAAIEGLPSEKVEQLAQWLDRRRSSVDQLSMFSVKTSTGAEVLAALRAAPPISEEELDALDAAQEADRPPEDKWRE